MPASIAPYRVLLCTMAFLWPWAPYDLVPFAYVPLSALATVGLVFCVTIEIRRGQRQRLRVPFELTWPPLLYGALCLSSGQWPGMLHALCFFATMHLAREKRFIEGLLQLSVVSSTLAAGVALLADSLPILPAAFHLPSGVTLSVGITMGNGMLVLAVAAALACTLAWRHARGRLLWLVCAAINGAALLRCAAGLFPVRDTWAPPALGGGVPVATALVILWLVARMGARLIVARREGKTGMHAGLAVVLLCAATYATAIPVSSSLPLAFLLALFAAYARLNEEGHAPSGLEAGLPLALFPLLAFNLCVVQEANPHDQRNYEHFIQAKLETGDFKAAGERLDFVEDFAPGEGRVDLWRARLELARGCPEAAAAAYCAALKKSKPKILAPLTEADRDSVLDRLRDAVSGMPPEERGLAYERALVASERTRDALIVLGLRAEDGAMVAPLDARPLAAALAFLLGDPGATQELESWESAKLLAALQAAGGQVRQAPLNLPLAWLPLVAACAREQRGTLCGLFTPSARETASWRASAGTPGPQAPSSKGDPAFQRNTSGDWHLNLQDRQGISWADILVSESPKLRPAPDLPSAPCEAGPMVVYLP